MRIKQKILFAAISVVVIITITTFFLIKSKAKIKEGVEVKPKAKVAIVIDDWGYSLRYINLLKQIDVPVTISVLPYLKHSAAIAEIAQKQGKKVILHLPLEPETGAREIKLEEHTILSNMSEKEVIENLNGALSSVPYVCGVSNHMGSRVTADVHLMSVLFTELKKRQLFFLDNLVTNESVGKQIANKMQIKFVSRDFFLDNLDDREYVKGQFNKLIDFALQNGQAIGIGHPRIVTLAVLNDMIPQMQEKGIKFVFVSDLVE
jgi:hypothetical protein